MWVSVYLPMGRGESCELVNANARTLPNTSTVQRPVQPFVEASRWTERCADACGGWNRCTQGPIVLELDTYRYHGHSMSDPGSTYRTRDEITSVRQARDPVERARTLAVELGGFSVAEIKEVRGILPHTLSLTSCSLDCASCPKGTGADPVRALGNERAV
jgi:hypothetical protein